MSRQVVWTRKILDTFIKEGNLTELETRIMETRISGMTVRQQSYYFNLSESSIARMIRDIKLKYDVAQKHSEILPPRKKSKAELYMDTH